MQQQQSPLPIITPGAAPVEPTQTELESIDVFCQTHGKLLEVEAQKKEKVSELKAKLVKVKENIKDYMTANNTTCLPLTIKDKQTGEVFEKYVRIKSSKGGGGIISGKRVKEILEKLTPETYLTKLREVQAKVTETEKKKAARDGKKKVTQQPATKKQKVLHAEEQKDERNLANWTSILLAQLVDQLHSSRKSTLELSDSKERKKGIPTKTKTKSKKKKNAGEEDDEVGGDAVQQPPEAIQKAMKEFYRLKLVLKRTDAEVKDTVVELKAQQETVTPIIEQYFEKCVANGQPAVTKVLVAVKDEEKPYRLKQKVRRQKGKLTVPVTMELMQRSFKEVLGPNRTTATPENVRFLLSGETITAVVSRLAELMTEYTGANAKVYNEITLDKVRTSNTEEEDNEDEDDGRAGEAEGEAAATVIEM